MVLLLHEIYNTESSSWSNMVWKSDQSNQSVQLENNFNEPPYFVKSSHRKTMKYKLYNKISERMNGWKFIDLLKIWG